MPDPLLEMFTWLAGDEARRAAASELHRRGLPAALVDDLIGATALAIGSAVIDARAIDRPIAYVRRALSSKTVDMLRGTIRQRGRETAWPEEFDVAGGTAGGGDPGAAVAAAMEDDIRRALHFLLARRAAWVGAAGLTTLTLAAHPDVAIPRAAPVPEGAASGQEDRWAALWLAGQRDCFPTTEQPDDAAMRQRRSRALRAIDAVLAEAAASIGLRADGA